MDKHTETEKIVLSFLKALTEDKHDLIETFYHPDAEQTEFPNAITPVTAVRNWGIKKSEWERQKNNG